MILQLCNFLSMVISCVAIYIHYKNKFPVSDEYIASGYKELMGNQVLGDVIQYGNRSNYANILLGIAVLLQVLPKSIIDLLKYI